MFIHITLAGSTFSSGTLPTMHPICLYTDIYQGLKIFANSRILQYMWIYITILHTPCVHRTRPDSDGVNIGHVWDNEQNLT